MTKATFTHGTLYKQHPKHYVAVDCIIFGFDREKIKLLVIKRNFEPMNGQWSLMGGFLQEGENLDQAAQRVLGELTGLSEVYLEQLYTYSDITRDVAGRVLSAAYYALINSDEFVPTMGKQHRAEWFDLGKLPGLIMDHNQMVEKALARLRRRCRTQPIGFELLPQKFTLPQLQQLYEAIFQESYDKRNFRKKILAMGILNQLSEKEKDSSRKGAYLYTFDLQKYNELKNKGFHFEL